ncbi:thiol-disulfide oxidoreductase DCC family protein [Nocardiopsis ansamitocini]|uniref:DUF393 domain-containing protein n=1 Tax=Nocardiopsis ansamitocini TaxID=1670832 RepID=A0A9W6UJ36_9ACTN|nr:DUF393 domain-containing protein [Nocardiopsis ansamitocini]GLU48093.1 hypothetical protein Nans01_24440 [Nocardiopsis ansamitocini]
MSAVSPVLVYDGDCAFCTVAAQAGQRHITGGGPVVWRPWQFCELSTPLEERAQREILLLHPDGRRVWGGVDAVAVLLLNSPHRYWWPLGSLLRRPVARGFGGAVYRWTARNRYRLPGGTPACQLHSD